MQRLNVEIKEIVKNYKGNTPIYVYVNKDKSNYRLSNEKWVTLNDELLQILKEKYGEENIKVLKNL